MSLVSNISINGPDYMERFGNRIANNFTHGDIVAINGPIGVGKTTLVRGIVSKFDANDEVTSPTFSIINYYPHSQIYHADLYRINTVEQMMLAGISEVTDDKKHLICIEWLDKFLDYIVPTFIINIDFLTSMSRNIVCTKTNHH